MMDYLSFRILCPRVISGAMLAVKTDHPVMIALSKIQLPTCYTQKVLIETLKCAGNVATVLHNSNTLDQQKFTALLGRSLVRRAHSLTYAVCRRPVQLQGQFYRVQPQGGELQ